MHEKKRIAVFGAGGIGGVVGGMLSKDGHDVTLIDTWHEHITEIQKNGLEVTNQDEVHNCKPNAIHLNMLQETKEKFKQRKISNVFFILSLLKCINLLKKYFLS